MQKKKPFQVQLLNLAAKRYIVMYVSYLREE